MNIQRTLEGGLRVDVEDSADWHLLSGIARDAASCDEKLADRLGRLVTDGELAPDWREYIIPDLDETFRSDVSHVATTISSALLESAGGPGPLWITREDAPRWYSALNQARLAIEEIHRFGPGENLRPEKLPPEKRSAFLRSRFYCAMQSFLLDQVMW